MSKEFLYTLLDSMSVSGHEIPLQKKVIAEMTPHCDKIITDYTGNVVCVLNPDAPFKVMLAAHIDEIGLIVTHIQPDGLLRVSKSGGIFPGVYPGHQVAVHGYAQTVYGAVVRSKDMDKADLKADELYIDIGAKDAADARKYVQEGDPVHMNTYHQADDNTHHKTQTECILYSCRSSKYRSDRLDQLIGSRDRPGA